MNSWKQWTGSFPVSGVDAFAFLFFSGVSTFDLKNSAGKQRTVERNVFLYKLDYKILISSNIQNQTHRILFVGRSYGASLLASFFSLLLRLHSADQDSDSVTVTWLLHHIFYFCASFKAGRALLEQKSQWCFGRGECPTDEKSQMLRSENLTCENSVTVLLSYSFTLWH